MTINQPTISTNGDVRSTFAEVDLSRLSGNLDAIKEKVGPTKVMLILKANAYGHGLKDVALYLAEKVDYFGVAVLEEGIFLREFGIKTPILVTGGIWGDQIPGYIQNDLTLTASSVERLEQIDQAAKS
jgi:alanine racemase